MLKEKRPVKPVRQMKLDTPIKPDHIRFVCIGCTHGLKIEPARVPPGDVLLVAGDFTTCGLPKEVAHFNKNLIATLNVRRLSTRERLVELEEALRRTHVDILAITELRWKGTGCIDLANTGYRFFYAGPENTTSPSGTGFLVSSRLTSYIDIFEREDDRSSRLDLRIGEHLIRCFSIYAPPSSCFGAEDDEQYSKFLEKLQKVLQQSGPNKICSSRITQKRISKAPEVHILLLGDFNAKLGKKENQEETCVGHYGYSDDRNDRGRLLIEFCEQHHLRASATFFKARNGRKWTWKSPDGVTRNCIDHIFACQHLRFTNVRTGTLNFETDHRLLRGTLQWPKFVNKAGRKTRSRYYLDRDIYKNVISVTCHSVSSCSRNRYEDLCKQIKNAAELATRRRESRSCLSSNTLALMKQRQQMKKTIETPLDRLAYTETCKMLRRLIREDIRLHHCRMVEKAVQSRQSLRRIRGETEVGHHQLFQLRNRRGDMCRSKTEISEVVKQFYEELYTSRVHITHTAIPAQDNCPPFLECEVEAALRSMKSGRTPGHDRITTEMVKWGGEMLTPMITELFNQCLYSGEVPEKMADAITILLHKKGDPSELKNYRPISLLSVLCKLLTKVINRRVENTLDSEQPREQAGFRRNYSTIDHLHAVNELIERCSEYQIPLFLAFVDYEKAFDTVEVNFLWNVLQEQGVHAQLIALLRGIYASARTIVKVGDMAIPINICRGVRQGDTISPKLFTAALEHIFRKLEWNEYGQSVNGVQLTNLRFADDVVLIAKSTQELQTMMNDLDEHSRSCGLKINTSKTKVMTAGRSTISIRGVQLEYVESFVYLGQKISLSRDHSGEVMRRIHAGWNSFRRYENFLSSRTVEMKWKRALFNLCVLPSMLYGAETWVLTKSARHKLAAAQRRMERCMVGIRLLDRRTNAWLRGVTKVKDVVASAIERKWAYSWKLAKSAEVKWSKELTEWRPPLNRLPGRPRTRWRDEFQKLLGTCNWQSIARMMTKKQWTDLMRCRIL
ncbi:hypothetical protein Y032_0012g1670 [Ancylostoma ceylanicum]|uniref:Reverse transcriptase domain-containing protein n=2 Tax=Ancylostoma ceylanicum TaxID=53326 RepID=A0A016VCD9_9BILA|nr:hypothetical protein Y032_0012g1670 [Ancylostoma ceylanicum]